MNQIKQKRAGARNAFPKLLLSACIAVIGLSACTDNPPTYPDPPAWEMQNIQMLANGNEAEITEGSLAAQKADSVQVRSFGEMMVMDHTDAQNKLMQVVSHLNRYVAPELDQMHQGALNRLKSLHGRAFDSTYIYMQLTDHQSTINLLQTVIANSSVDLLRNYAQQTLPVVQMHYQHADSIATNMFP